MVQHHHHHRPISLREIRLERRIEEHHPVEHRRYCSNLGRLRMPTSCFGHRPHVIEPRGFGHIGHIEINNGPSKWWYGVAAGIGAFGTYIGTKIFGRHDKQPKPEQAPKGDKV